MITTSLNQRIDEWVEANRQRIVDLAQRLVRISSENHPPGGDEAAVQTFLETYLRDHGFEPDVYDIGTVPGLDDHPLRHADVQCSGRPNLALALGGQRPKTARSLILSGHCDTVPAGNPAAWSMPPNAGLIDGTRLYGRGAYDMKAGLAANMAIAFMLRDLKIDLDGDLLIESVVDEEFAGGHGTLAARLRYGGADAVLLPEPSNLVPYRAHRGLRLARMTLRGKGGVTFAGDHLHPPAHDLPALIRGILEFGEMRNRETRIPEAYADNPVPANWMITKVKANDWRDDALLAVPETAHVELFWETMPGETREQIEHQFETWLASFREQTGIEVTHEYVLRWMAGYQLPPDHPLAACVERHHAAVTGKPESSRGAPFPCDLFLFAELGVPAGMILGPAGNNAHAADEWVDLDSLLDLVRLIGRIVCDWCSTPKDLPNPHPNLHNPRQP